MKSKKQAMCPLFPDVVCPQGQEAADACQVRQNGDYDPVNDFRDYLYMNCAVQIAHRQSESEKKITGKQSDE